MQYNQLFIRTKNILRSPRSEWKIIKSTEPNSQKVLNDFILPMAGLCALTSFLGLLFQSAGFEKALVSVIISLGKSFGGVYFSFFILQETARFFELKRNKTSFMQIAGYSYVVIFVIDMIVKLIPELFFLPFLELYVVYIIWEAADTVLKVADNKRVTYVLFASAVVLISAFGLEGILSSLIKASTEIVA